MSNAASDFADAVLHDHAQQQQQHAAQQELHDGRTLSARPYGGSSMKPEAGPSQAPAFGNAPAPIDATWLARLLADALVGVPAAANGAYAAPGVYPASAVAPPGDDALSQISRLQSKLNQRLGPEYIAKRPGFSGGPMVPYLEGWKAVDLANEVFGFNGWSSSICSLEVDFCDVDEQGRIKIGVSCIMRITLRDGTYHEDVGHGQMEGTKSKAVAFQKAKKEAATDALKRTIKSFGKLLGNCLYDKRYMKVVDKMAPKHEEYSVGDLKRAPDMAALRAANAEREKAAAARAAAASTSTDVQMNDEGMPPPPARTAAVSSSSGGGANSGGGGGGGGSSSSGGNVATSSTAASTSGGMGARSHTTPAPGPAGAPAARRAEEERQRRLHVAAQKKAEMQAAAAARKSSEEAAAAAAAAAAAQMHRPTTAQMLDEVDEDTLSGALDYAEDEAMFGSQDFAADSGESEAAAMALEMQLEEEARMRALHGPQFRRAATTATPAAAAANPSSSRTASGETAQGADDSGIGLEDDAAAALRVKQEYVEQRARAAMPPPKRAGSKGRFSAPAPANGASSLSAAAARSTPLAVRSSPRRATTTAPRPTDALEAAAPPPRGLAYAQGRPVGHAYVGTLGAKRGAQEPHRQPLGNLPLDEHGATKRPRV